MTHILMGMVAALLLVIWLPWRVLLVVGGLLAVGVLYALWRRQPRLVWALLLMLCCGSYGGYWVSAKVQSRVPVALVGQEGTLTVRIEAVTATRFGGQRLRVGVLGVETLVAEPKWTPKTLSLQDSSKQSWPLGSIWRLNVRLQAPIGQLNPAGYEAGRGALLQGLDGGGRILPAERLWLRQQHNLSSWGEAIRAKAQARVVRLGEGQVRGAALVSALSLGQRQGLTPELWQLFRVTGLNHLVSISGLHVTLVAGFVAFWVQYALRGWRRPRGNSRLYTGTAGLLAAVIYAAVSGFAIPTQRSVLMLAVALWLLQARFYVTVWVVWWAAAVLVLLNNPGAALSIGFWLSFLLVAALLWVSGGRRRLRPIRWWASLLQLQWTATVASLVPVAYFFGEVPISSFLVNLVAIPWTTMVLIPMSILGQLLPFDAVLAWAISLSDASLRLLLQIEPWAWTWAVPHLPWPLWVSAGLGTVLLLLPRGLPVYSAALLCLALPLAYQPARPSVGELRVIMWDIGQGLSLLLQTRGQNILYDTGPEASGQTVLQNLRALGVKRLDDLILSHDDADHDAGWRPLYQALQPERFWAGVPEAYAPIPATHCHAGRAWVVDDVYFEWLTPAVAASSNELSCVLRVIAGSQAILLTGDLEGRGEAYLARTYGDDLFSQVLILGHHGSKTSSTAVFLRHVAPSLGVASSGFANRYGHPHEEVLERLRQQQVAVYRTDLSGALQLDLGEALTVRPLTASQRWWRQKPLLVAPEERR